MVFSLVELSWRDGQPECDTENGTVTTYDWHEVDICRLEVAPFPFSSTGRIP